MILLPVLCIIAGIAILAAASNLIVGNTPGGYASDYGMLVVAVAAGIAVGAVAIGLAWGHGHRVLTAVLVFMIIAAEGYAFLATVEREIGKREAVQKPAAEVLAKRERYQAELASKKTLLAEIPAISQRLEAALASKARADEAAINKAAERGCASNCRALLQAQVDSASQEVAAARAALQVRTATERARIEGEIADVEAKLASTPVPASGTGLADRLGLAPWVMDVISAALLAFGSNGLAAALIAVGAHCRPREAAQAARPVAPLAEAPAKHPEVRLAALPAPRLATQQQEPIENVATYLQDVTQPDPKADARVVDLMARYRAWAADRPEGGLSQEEFGPALGALVKRAGLAVSHAEGRGVVVHGMRLSA